MSISEDRWTCPQCNWTMVISMRVGAWETLRAAQDRHAIERGHGQVSIAPTLTAEYLTEGARAV